MECPKCQFYNREGVKFCEDCGTRFELECPACKTNIPFGRKFCGECGYDLSKFAETTQVEEKDFNHIPEAQSEQTLPAKVLSEGERKHVTVLFSDLTGYTSMTDKMDPEEVKEVTTQIFGEISKIVDNYGGFVEKFAGDAVMAMFGATTSHEDDPIRAIRAATEIHNVVKKISPKYEEILEQPLSMHTGINTGLVVTGDVNLEKGTHGVAGDTLNVAARLSSIGQADDIMVGHDTFCQAEGFFDFKALEPTKVKGKTEPVRIYKVLSLKEHPRKVHRLQGVRSELIGREAEMQQLKSAVNRLKQGQGTIISICGTAGTGKSRLIEEFKASLDLKTIQWQEGHAFPYSQDISYAPFIELMNRVFRINEDDSPDTIKEKVENGIAYLDGNKRDIVPYVGGLYEIKYPEIEGEGPDFWKSGLQKATQEIISGLTRMGPAVICLEDLHWADPSSIDMLHFLFSNFSYPAIFLCAYRPVFTLFTSHQINNLGNAYEEIQLLGLSPTEVHTMVESLLKTRSLSFELKGFVQKKVEGNPFFLEELINSLIESETLMQENGTWKLIKPITESEIPATIHGVLAARFDRLESEKKRVLQEASVIGRTFFYDILKKVTNIRDQCDQCLSALERLDLVRTKSFQPDLEYIFKHALTQEVVYNGILKKERRILHEKIGIVMEQLFQDRLSEFYETLAFHFKKGQSMIKAIEYLMKAAEKSFGRYALEESHQSYKEAFDLLSRKPEKSAAEEELLIDLLMKWAWVMYYLAHFEDIINLFKSQEDLAISSKDRVKQGMYKAWLGFAMCMNGEGKAAYQYLDEALELGKETGDQQLICHAYCWFSYVFWDLGFLDKGIAYAEKAWDLAKTIETTHYFFHKSSVASSLITHYLYHKPLIAISLINFYTGDYKRAYLDGKDMLDYGKKHSYSRSIAAGHVSIAFSHHIPGDLQSAFESYQQAVETAKDNLYLQFNMSFYGAAYLLAGQIQEAEELLEAALARHMKINWGLNRRFTKALLGAVKAIKGEMKEGVAALEEEINRFKENEALSFYVFLEFILGFVYLQKFMEGESTSYGMKAEKHFSKAAETARKIGAKLFLGNCCYSLGMLHSIQGQFDRARPWTSEAVQVFEELQIDSSLQQAQDLLSSLG